MTIELTPIHPKDARAANPRLQCVRCGKWARHMSRRDGVAHYNFLNVPDADIDKFGFQECCRTCFEEIYPLKEVTKKQ